MMDEQCGEASDELRAFGVSESGINEENGLFEALKPSVMHLTYFILDSMYIVEVCFNHNVHFTTSMYVAP